MSKSGVFLTVSGTIAIAIKIILTVLGTIATAIKVILTKTETIATAIKVFLVRKMVFYVKTEVENPKLRMEMMLISLFLHS